MKRPNNFLLSWSDSIRIMEERLNYLWNQPYYKRLPADALIELGKEIQKEKRDWWRKAKVK